MTGFSLSMQPATPPILVQWSYLFQSWPESSFYAWSLMMEECQTLMLAADLAWPHYNDPLRTQDSAEGVGPFSCHLIILKFACTKLVGGTPTDCNLKLMSPNFLQISLEVVSSCNNILVAVSSYPVVSSTTIHHRILGRDRHPTLFKRSPESWVDHCNVVSCQHKCLTLLHKRTLRSGLRQIGPILVKLLAVCSEKNRSWKRKLW